MSFKKEHPLEHDVSILSEVTVVEGNFFTKGNLRIDGKVNGNVESEGNISTGEHSEINGNITAKNITVCGKVKGNLTSQETILIQKTASLEGDLIAKVLIVQEGAVFNGNSKMISGN